MELRQTDETDVARVGAKAAALGELSRIDGLRVPDGLCVTTGAFAGMLARTPSVDELLDRLSRVDLGEQETIRAIGVELRRVIERAPVPDELVTELGAALERRGEHTVWAVRSSATVEDLPTASFAGQLDSYLDVVGPASVLAHVRRCWASLFTERAMTYRLRNGFDHRRVLMAVLVQQQVPADAAGVLFTADPVTSDRTIVTVEAVAGLGEALVSGTANADVWAVRDDEIIPATARRDDPVLTDSQVVRLAQLGRRIEAHFGAPQDVEWCLADGDVHVVQSRPITTLFPVPEVTDDEKHVYLSVGHQQMMTDPFRPLGLSLWHLTTSAVMTEAGGWLYVDVTRRLASPDSRDGLLELVGTGDPLTGDALRTVLDRAGFLRPPAGEDLPGPHLTAASTPIETDPAIVAELIEQNEVSLDALTREIRTLSGPALFDFMLTAFEEDKRLLFDPRGMQVITAGMQASALLNDHLLQWLGETNAADELSQSAPRNVTAEMGLALLDVADVIRPHHDVVTFLQRVGDEARTDGGFLKELVTVDGGEAARDAIEAFLDRYGMRCAGEIDITRPRWSEQPAALVPTLLANTRNFDTGAAAQRFERGRQQARRKQAEVVTRLRALPDGDAKAAEVEQLVDRVRTFAGYREYPKYNRICRAFVYKQALLREAESLVRAQVLGERDDIFYLRFEELREAVRTKRVDPRMIEQRKEAFRSFRSLTPPRVLTSDGETISGAYRRDDLPPGALAGLAVSAGIVEGWARVTTDMARADVEPGDILVTGFTDPSWTPLFVGIAGLVTEVGGLMTHGAVIAREYGLPAVVAVTGATRLIRDGQRIRVHGTQGYVEILS